MKRLFTWMSVAVALYSSVPALAQDRRLPPNGNPGTVHDRDDRGRDARERREREARDRRGGGNAHDATPVRR